MSKNCKNCFYFHPDEFDPNGDEGVYCGYHDSWDFKLCDDYRSSESAIIKQLEAKLKSAKEVIFEMSLPPYPDSNLKSLLKTLNGVAKKWLKDNKSEQKNV